MTSGTGNLSGDQSSQAETRNGMQLMDAQTIQKTIDTLAGEIGESLNDPSRAVIVGIPNRGVELAQRLRAAASANGHNLKQGVVDVSMHRDDLRTRNFLPHLRETKLPNDLDGREIILVDDVYYTGRTCRAALDALLSYGRPARVLYAVLIDRDHAELPIRPNFIGLHRPTEKHERVAVRFENIDDQPDSVWLYHS